MDSSDRTAIIAVNWKRHELVDRLLDCIHRHFRPQSYLVAVIDNESNQPNALERWRAHPVRPTVVPLADNLGYAHAVNRGLALLGAAGPSAYLVLNNDITFASNILHSLRNRLAYAGAGFVGPVNRRPDGTVETAGVDVQSESPYVVHHRLTPPSHSQDLRVDALQGSALAFSAVTLARIGPLDEGYFYGWEETDWCLRAHRAGLDNWVVGQAEVYHDGTASLGGPDGYNPVVEYMLLRNQLYFLAHNGFGNDCVEAHTRFWLANSHVTTFREHDTPPPDPSLARRVIESAVAAFRAGQRGPWPAGIAALRAAATTEGR